MKEKIFHPEIIVARNHNKYLAQLFLMAATAAIFFICSCQNKTNGTANKKNKYLTDNNQEKRIDYFNSKVYPVMQQTAQSGDLITRMGTDITSLMLSKVNPTDTSYSHCGILNIENDSVIVYHCIGGEFNPDQKMKREPLYVFAHPENSKRVGLFSPDFTNPQKVQLMQHVKGLYASGLMFDMDFDLTTDDRQYCSEMIAKSIGQVLGNLKWVTITASDSLQWISIDNLYLNDLMVEKMRFNY